LNEAQDQALLLAVERIRSVLDASKLVLWKEGMEHQEPGFPRMVPLLYGRHLAQKLESYIARETDVFKG